MAADFFAISYSTKPTASPDAQLIFLRDKSIEAHDAPKTMSVNESGPLLSAVGHFLRHQRG
jgi:hypothetical protein